MLRFTELSVKAMMIVWSVFVLTSCNSFNSSGTFYVSYNGDDSNSGKSKSAAFKTITRVNDLDLNPGEFKVYIGGSSPLKQSIKLGAAKPLEAVFLLK